MRIVIDPPEVEQVAHLMVAAAQEMDVLTATLQTRPLPEAPPAVEASVNALVRAAARTVSAGTTELRNEAAQLELRALVAEGIGSMPSGPTVAGKSWVDRLISFSMDAGQAERELLMPFLRATKPVRVSGYWRGATWVKAYRRSMPGQTKVLGRIEHLGNVLSFLTAASDQLDEDAGKHYPLGERLLRAGTAGGLSAAAGTAVGTGAEALVGATGMSLLPEALAVEAIPGVGEVAAVVVLSIAAGYVVDRFLMPTVKKDVLRFEHWAYHQGAEDLKRGLDGAIDFGKHARDSAVHDLKSGFGFLKRL